MLLNSLIVFNPVGGIPIKLLLGEYIFTDYLQEKLSNIKILYQEHGTDPRNYKVSFEKVKFALGFEPSFTINDGINELLEAINKNMFENVEKNRNFYGNYEINYPAKT